MPNATLTALLDDFTTKMRAAIAALPDGVTLFADDFAAGLARWTDWYQSPGWIRADAGTLAITTPAATHGAPTSPIDTTYTHAAIAAAKGVTSTAACVYEARVKLVRQTRTGGAGNQPNAWEVPWVMFRFTDERHYYYVHFKAHHLRDMTQDYGGIEIGKYNTTTGGLYEANPGQEVLWNFSAADLRARGVPFDYAANGQWYDYRIDVRDVPGGVNIIVKLNGVVVANVTDVGNIVAYGHTRPTPPLPAGGTIALYCEDADVRFDNVRVTALG